MKITKLNTGIGYDLIISVKSHNDLLSLENTLNYMVSKKKKSLYARRGKIVPLARMLKEAI